MLEIGKQEERFEKGGIPKQNTESSDEGKRSKTSNSPKMKV